MTADYGEMALSESAKKLKKLADENASLRDQVKSLIDDREMLMSHIKFLENRDNETENIVDVNSTILG
jgi:predicted nuclease with TOPRIM domain